MAVINYEYDYKRNWVTRSEGEIDLSHKLRCNTGISGPKKSRNNTREKISYLFTCVDIANQLLTLHSPLAPLG